MLKKLPFDFLAVLTFYFINYQNKVWTPYHFVGICIAIPSLFLWILARYQLGKSFAVLPKAKELVTTGLYSKIRNPVYIFSTLSLLGLILPSFSVFQYVVLGLITILQFYRSQKESVVLEKKFGESYMEYKKGTWF